MRIRSVSYFINKMNSNNCKKGPKNQSEIINEELAEYFAEKSKETKKVA